MYGRTFYRCPDCGQKQVYHKLASGRGEDGWTCRNPACEFWAYVGGNDGIDVVRRKRIVAANPGVAEINVGSCYCDDGEVNPACPEHSTIESYIAAQEDWWRELYKL